jgi:anti-anti-sigma factor
MPNAPGDHEHSPSMRAATRVAERGDRQQRLAASVRAGPATSVSAHLVLNDLSVALLGAAALDEGWDHLSDDERRTVAARVHSHMAEVAERVKDLVRQPPASAIGTARPAAQVRVRVQGPVDADTGGYLRERVVEAGVEPGRREVLLDLYAVTSMDVDGLAAVLRIQRELAATGVRLAVMDASDHVRPALEAYGLAEPSASAAVTLDLRS